MVFACFIVIPDHCKENIRSERKFLNIPFFHVVRSIAAVSEKRMFAGTFNLGIFTEAGLLSRIAAFIVPVRKSIVKNVVAGSF